MKKLIWLLILINVGLLAYFNRDRILPSQPQVRLAEIDPEKISLLSQTQIEVLPKKTAETTPIPPTPQVAITSCFEWGSFAASSLAGAQSAVARLALQAVVKEQPSAKGKRFWIYRPPFKSAQEAQARASELKALGINDLFVVQEPKWKNAISFGIFEDEQLATKLLNELKTKGVKDAAKTLRNQGKDHASLLFKSLSDSQATELRQLKPEFPEAELKEVACQ
jgi:hypothetical protein